MSAAVLFLARYGAESRGGDQVARERGIARAYALGRRAAADPTPGPPAPCPYGARVHREAWAQGYADARATANHQARAS